MRLVEQRLKTIIRWSPLHPSFIARVGLRKAILKQVPLARGTVLDVGCDRQPYRAELARHGNRYVGTDIQNRPGVDFTSTVMALPVRDGAVDTVFMTEVLEHVPDPFKAMDEVLRVLKPGGTLILTAPQTWGLHGEPHDYYRFTRHGLRAVLERAGFEIELLEPYGGTIGAASARLADGWAEYLLPPRSRPLSRWGWRLGLVPVGLAFWVPVNVFGYLFDKIFRIRYDPIGHVVVAVRPGPVEGQ